MAIHLDPRLTRENVAEIQDMIKYLRGRFSERWGFVLDLKDDMSQVMRCIYADTGDSGLIPVMNVPLIANLSWRVTGIERNEPLFFGKVDMNDPRSFYLRRTVGAQQMVLVPIRSDSNIGLLTMVNTVGNSDHLSKGEIEEIQRQCNKLVPLVQSVSWKLEQEILNDAMDKIRKRESPLFVSQLFNRLLELPIIFLEKSGPITYRTVCQYGLPKQVDSSKTVFRLENPEKKKFLQFNWRQVCDLPDLAADQRVTAVILDTGEHAILALGEILLRGQTRDDFTHYVEQAERLLRRPPYRISTLTFLLHLQHWIRGEDRDIQVIFQHIVDALVPFLQADFGTLVLIDREKAGMLLVSQAGEFKSRLRKLPLDTTGDREPASILEWVATHGKPFLAADVSKVPFYKSFNTAIRSEMCVPIHVRGETIGMFSVSSRRTDQFGQEDLSKLGFFSDQIGIALYQAGLLEKAFVESEVARKLDQEIRFGFHAGTHAKDLTYNFGNLVGNPNGSMGKVFAAIQRINNSGRDDLNVLITGETGCGKEMVSFALHNSSRRAQRPMVVANFASYGGDPNLIQSELFGHEKGSFSGASHRRIGCIEQAHDSTLLIDEVGDIVSSVQIKLLRVLQQSAVKKFQRLGGQETIKSNVRILAATHKDLWKEVQEGRFREDLFYRLQTLVVRIPPLRERLEDIPLLIAHFTAKYERMVPDLKITWTEGAMRSLQSYSWPGNVRQLEAVMNRALVLYTEGGLVTEDAIGQSLDAERRPLPAQISLFKRVCEGGEGAFWQLVREPYRQHDITRSQLKDLVRDSLEATKGSYKQAARMMGVLEKDYNRFLDFLKNAGTKLDYREFRREG